jgi:SAM-dependent methyltransferase
MSDDTPVDFIRYLAAKRSVDDRALNAHVWRVFREVLPPEPRRILEIGAGIGTMVERLAHHDMLGAGTYTAIDAEPANIVMARERLAAVSGPVNLELEAIDAFDFAARERDRQRWDVLIAHAFLDLIDVPAALPSLFALLRPGGVFAFTINFDGLTILEPEVDPPFDEEVITAYHRTMDERVIGGQLSGDSRAGRHLIGHLRAAGAIVHAAGASDWVVMAGPDGRYPADEAAFLRSILGFFETSLTDRPDLDPERFARWLAARRTQIDAGELLYIAHQLDVVGVVPA